MTGEQLPVSVVLSSRGVPLPGAGLQLSVGAQDLLLLTDAKGTATYKLKRDTPPGTYPVSVAYQGDSVRSLLPGTAAGQLTVLPRLGSTITLSLPPATIAGQEVPIGAVLRAGGLPLAESTLRIAVDGEHKLTLLTDANGAITYKLSRDTPVGTHTIVVTYHGVQRTGIAAAAATGTIKLLAPIRTWINLTLPPPTKAGQKVVLGASLQSENGPLGGRAIHLSIDGKPKLELITDSSGHAHLDASRATPAGNYAIGAEFHGNQAEGLAPTSATGAMTIVPLMVSVQTVPALPGVTVRVDGQEMRTNADGTATVAVGTTGEHSLSLGNPTAAPGAQVQFARWSDGVTTASRPIRMLADFRIYAGFSGDFLTRLRFIDADGVPVATTKISDLILAGPEGASIPLHYPFDPVWLHVPAPSRAVLDGVTQIHKFSVGSGNFEGSSVINRGDDVYTPYPGGDWTIKLRLYSLRIHTRHPLIGGGMPRSVDLARAGAAPIKVGLDASGNSTLKAVPRGSYTITTPHTRLAAQVLLSLSRSQEVTIPVVSATEVVSSLGLLTLLAMGLILLPRRRRLLRLLRR